MANILGSAAKLATEQIEKRGGLELAEKGIESLRGWIQSSESSIGRTEVGKALIDHLTKFEPYNKRISQEFLSGAEREISQANPQTTAAFTRDITHKLAQRGARVKISPTKSVKLRDALNAGIVKAHELVGYDEKVFQRGTDLNKQAIAHLVQSGQARDSAEAWDALKSIGAAYHGRNGASQYLSHGYDLPIGKLDPQNTLRQFALAAGRKVTEVDAFGPNDEILNGFIEAAKRAHGPVHADAINEFMSIYLKDRVGRFAYHGQDEIERRAREGSSWIFTSRIAIPHLTQWLNEGLISSMNSMAKATGEMMKDYEGAKAFALRSGALVDEMRYEIEALARGQKDGIISKVMHQPFFKAERKLELVHAAVTGKHELIRLWNVLQKNPNSKEAQVMMKFFGVDSSRVLANGGLTQNDMLTAAFRSAQEVMYIRTARHTPYKWEQNWVTRLAAMYKHFMFNEGSHIYNSLKRSYKIGPASLARQVAYLGVVFPAAGAMIQLADNLVTGHKMEEQTVTPLQNLGATSETSQMIDSYLNSVAHMAGFGLVTSMLRSAKNRGLHGFIEGPIFGSLVDVGQDAWMAAHENKKGTHNIAPLARDIGRLIPVAGPAITHWLFPPKEKKDNTYY